MARGTDDDGVLEALFTFDTTVSTRKGYPSERGNCWTLLTTMTELKQFPEKTGEARVQGVQHGVLRNRKSWLEIKAREEADLGYARQPYCVIVGGGQGGIGLAARLKRLDVPTIIHEKNKSPRGFLAQPLQIAVPARSCLVRPYALPAVSGSLAHLFPKDKIGDWLEMYTKIMELNYWHSTECKSALYDEEAQEWIVTVNRDGQTVVLRPKQLVLATGMSGMPNVPEIPGASTFKGVQCHSSKFTSGEEL